MSYLKIWLTLRHSTDPELPYVEGFVKEGFGKVKDIFRENLSNGSDKGSSFAAYYRGELVVNLWGGWVEASQRWKEDTYHAVFLLSHKKGLLSYAEKISKYWPEFGQNGKENITLETYITHKAGLFETAEPFPVRLILDDPHKSGEILAKQKPFWEPGTKHGYHPITFALYSDQIVRRVDTQGRSLSQYFQEEIAKPFGNRNLYRVLHWTTEGVILQSSPYYTDARAKIDEMNDFEDGAMNDPYIREIPSGSSEGHGTVAALAKFHSILATGGVYKGKRLLSEKAIKRQIIPKSCGPDAVFGFDYTWSLGTMLFAAADENEKPIFSFGHEGYGGQLAVADPTFKVGYAFGTNHLNTIREDKPGKDMRSLQLGNALYECIYKIENRTTKRRAFESYSELKEYQKSLSK